MLLKYKCQRRKFEEIILERWLISKMLQAFLKKHCRINRRLWFLLFQGISFYNIHTIDSVLINIFMQAIYEDIGGNIV